MELTLTPKAEKFIGRMIRFNGGTSDHGFRLIVSPVRRPGDEPDLHPRAVLFWPEDGQPCAPVDAPATAAPETRLHPTLPREEITP